MLPSADPDVWWHLRTGDHILDTNAIPTSDPFSWTAQGRAWTAHEWGSQVLLATVDRSGGPAALRVLVGLSVGIAALFVLRLIRRFSDDLWVQSVVLFGFLALSFATWTVRPHIFSLPLFALFLERIVSFHKNSGPLPWVLVPLTLVWANLHGVFVAGVALIWVATTAIWFTDRAKARSLATIALAATAVGSLNPGGPLSYLYPLHVADVSRRILEWQPTTVTKGFGLAFVLIVIAIPALYAWRRRRPDPVLGAIALAFVLSGFFAFKNVWMAGVALVPLATQALIGVFPPPSHTTRKERRAIASACAAIALLGAGGTAATLAVATEGQLRSEEAFPREAVELLAEQPPGRVMNSYGYGGYLMWKAPHIPVAMDGRNDMYGNDLLNRYFKLQDLEPGWRDVLDGDEVRYVLWEPQEPLSEALRLLPESWTVLYEDDISILFTRT